MTSVGLLPAPRPWSFFTLALIVSTGIGSGYSRLRPNYPGPIEWECPLSRGSLSRRVSRKKFNQTFGFEDRLTHAMIKYLYVP